jgi:hypothetical protein
MAILSFVRFQVKTLFLGNRFLREQEFTSRRRVYLIGVSWSRIQESKSIYVEEVVMTL